MKPIQDHFQKSTGLVENLDRVKPEADKKWQKEIEKAEDELQKLCDAKEKAWKRGRQPEYYDGVLAEAKARMMLSELRGEPARKRGQISDELSAITTPYLQHWVEELFGESKRLEQLRHFEVIETTKNPATERKTYKVRTNFDSIAKSQLRLIDSMAKLRTMVFRPLSESYEIFNDAIASIPEKPEFIEESNLSEERFWEIENLKKSADRNMFKPKMEEVWVMSSNPRTLDAVFQGLENGTAKKIQIGV